MATQTPLLRGLVVALVAGVADLLVDGEDVTLKGAALGEDAVTLVALVALPVVGHVDVTLEVEGAVSGVVAILQWQPIAKLAVHTVKYGIYRKQYKMCFLL